MSLSEGRVEDLRETNIKPSILETGWYHSNIRRYHPGKRDQKPRIARDHCRIEHYGLGEHGVFRMGKHGVPDMGKHGVPGLNGG